MWSDDNIKEFATIDKKRKKYNAGVLKLSNSMSQESIDVSIMMSYVLYKNEFLSQNLIKNVLMKRRI